MSCLVEQLRGLDYYGPLGGLADEAADTIEALREALRCIMNVRVCKSDNIWAGADKCRNIAADALTKAEKSWVTMIL